MVLILNDYVRPDGALLTRDLSGSGWTQVGETLQCRHCQMHWQVMPGSGKRRGWCPHCAGPTCGAAKCEPCDPFEAKLERIESAARLSESLDRIRAL